MKGEKILKILEVLEEVATSYLELFDVLIFKQPRGISGVQRELLKVRGKREKLFFTELKEYLKEKEKLTKLLYKLKKEGFISEDKKKNKLFLTEKGKLKLKILRRRKLFEENKNKEDKKENKDVIVLIYDIPESERKKRNDLRIFLTLNGFSFIQRSVWIKQGKITEDFINYLKDINVFDYVQIFKITKQGTIKVS